MLRRGSPPQLSAVGLRGRRVALLFLNGAIAYQVCAADASCSSFSMDDDVVDELTEEAEAALCNVGVEEYCQSNSTSSARATPSHSLEY